MAKHNVVQLAEEVSIDPRFDLTYSGIRQIIEAVNGSTSEGIMMAFNYGYRQGMEAATDLTDQERELVRNFRRLNANGQEKISGFTEYLTEDPYYSAKVTMIHTEEETQ